VDSRRLLTQFARIAAACVLVGLLATSWSATTQATSVRVVSHGPRSQPVIALTFDDGVSPANCRRILATLVEQHVPATFFPLAEAMSLDPAFWRLVAAVGDPVGDHTYSHPQLPALSLAGQFTEIDRGRRVAEAVLGRPLLRVFRPPYGAYNAVTLSAAARAGFSTVLLWDVSDRSTSPTASLAKMRWAAEQGTNGSVVLMHCGPNVTPYLLSDVIASYRARGFRFVTVAQILGVPWSAGPTRAVTPKEILHGLAPLPPGPDGGPITGPHGYLPPRMSAPPAVAAPVVAKPVTHAATPAPPSVIPRSTADSNRLPSPAAVLAKTAQTNPAPLPDDRGFGAVVGLAVLAGAVGSVAFLRRFRRT
jgi:peptidoglycan/xylan/chitin deacetylase (PgdA/CDA1 family)